MASTAMLALITSGAIGVAVAQDQPAEQPAVVEQPAATEEAAGTEVTTDVAAGEAEEVLTPEEPTIATAFLGTSVFSSEDPESDNIGEVNDLIIGSDGMITHAVIGVGGFLGIGEKDVAVPFNELQVVEQDGDIRLVYAATREQLEAAEEYDRTAYDPRAREAEEQAAEAEQQALEEQAAVEATEPADPMAPAEEDMAAAPAEEQPAEEAAESTETAEAPAEEQPATEDQAAADAEMEPSTDEQTAEAPAEEPAAEETDMAAAPEEQPAESADVAEAPAEEQLAESTDMAAAPAEGHEGFVGFAEEQVRASELIGQEVFGAEEESIGEISDLVLDQDGETRVALIDVGGFLGVGEKRVAIPFNEIQISQEGEEEPRVVVAYGQADLESFPTYEEPQEDMAATEEGTTEETATEETDVAATEEPAVEEPATGEGAAMTGSAPQDISAAELLGARVFSPEEENIGEVGDVVFSEDGMIQAVLVDVGGFLGVGEKEVALQFDALQIQEDENGDFWITANASQEQLEGAAAYEEQAAQ
jgi:sporulation protein YlmC with PRC-barrel domain